MDGVLRVKLEQYSEYIDDYESILYSLEELEKTDIDAYLYMLEYISYVLRYLEIHCDQNNINVDTDDQYMNLQDVYDEQNNDINGTEDSSDDFDFSEYVDESDEEDIVTDEDSGEINFSEYGDYADLEDIELNNELLNEDKINGSEHNDNTNKIDSTFCELEEVDFSEYESKDDEIVYEIDNGFESGVSDIEEVDYFEYEDDSVTYDEIDCETDELFGTTYDEEVDYSEYEDQSEEDINFNDEFDLTGENNNNNVNVGNNNCNNINNNFNYEGSSYDEEVDFSEYTDESEDTDLDINGLDTDVDFSDFDKSNQKPTKTSKNDSVIDTSEFDDNVDFPDFELSRYNQPKIFEDDIANKMAGILQKISEGAKNFMNNKKK